MARVILIALLIIILVGCGSNPVKTETEVQRVEVPILYCPAPEDVQRPQLAIETITEDDTDGEIAKKYKATIKQLQSYSKQLEAQLDEYNNTNQSYEQLRERFRKQWEQGEFSNNSEE